MDNKSRLWNDYEMCLNNSWTAPNRDTLFLERKHRHTLAAIFINNRDPLLVEFCLLSSLSGTCEFTKKVSDPDFFVWLEEKIANVDTLARAKHL